ncbi:PREDICTED: uncharacterized protein LOC107162536 [Diuraphis noxia]|uniref:uncharacterized protein LOC107162536 n=1 Tax=Diuraphis noxia TaxID=143948 RepID=UPI0007637908|nr:PREDICTED: uncharacterized protein LOC107162536 [Diuraphis noxia]
MKLTASISLCFIALFGSNTQSNVTYISVSGTNTHVSHILIFILLSYNVDGEDIVRVARGCVYNKADLCRGMQRLDDELKTLKYCGSCDDDGCNGSMSLKSSAVAIILTTVATCLFYQLQH